VILKNRVAAFGIAGVAALVAACGSSSSSSSGGGGASGGFAAVQAAFANYGNQPSAHLKITQTGSSFDVDVTKDGMSGSASLAGQQVSIVYAGGHGYVQTSAGGPFIQIPDAEAKPLGLFTISTFSTCFGSFLTSKSPQITASVSSSSTTLNGQAAVDYKSPDGQAEIIVSAGSNPLPLRLVGQSNGSSSSSSSSSTNPACDLGSSSSSSSTDTSGGSVTIDWTYPGAVSTITPPPTASST
jgi:hypothetical protein